MNLFFSYETPVPGWLASGPTLGFFKNRHRLSDSPVPSQVPFEHGEDVNRPRIV